MKRCDLHGEFLTWLNQHEITAENIGDIRRCCFVPWNSSWNSIVREETARRQR